MSETRVRWVAAWTCVLMSIVFGLQVSSGFDPAFSASEPVWWKFFASILGHGGLEHLLNNLFFIGLFGSLYERLTSGRVFLATFFGSALLANLSAFVFYPGTSIIGASGGGFGVMAALAVYRPRRVGLALGVPMPMWAALATYGLIQFAGLSSGPPGTAFEAHILGAAAGATAGAKLRDPDRGDYEEEDKDHESWKQRIRQWENENML